MAGPNNDPFISQQRSRLHCSGSEWQLVKRLKGKKELIDERWRKHVGIDWSLKS